MLDELSDQFGMQTTVDLIDAEDVVAGLESQENWCQIHQPTGSVRFVGKIKLYGLAGLVGVH